MSQFLAVLGGQSEPALRLNRGALERVFSPWPGEQRTEEIPGAALTMKLVAPDEGRREGCQPFADFSRQLAVIADCRLESRGELAETLGIPNDCTDAEMLVRGYQRWGEDLPSHLRGDFAGVIWDWRIRQCLVFRDRLGVKPIFFKRDGARLWIASDVELIGDLIGYGEVDRQKVVEHLLWRYASVDKTFWESIERLPGGHFLVGAPQRVTRRRYWRPAIRSVRTEPEATDVLAALFRQSVERRMSGFGTIFAHLSGGLDSSSIVCAAAAIAQRSAKAQALTTVSERFPGSATDEGPFIRAVLAWTKVEGVEWDDPSPSLGDVQHPCLAGPGIDTYRTSGSTGDLDIIARAGGRILLSGLGGDQFGSAVEVADDMVERRPLEFVWDTLFSPNLSRAQRLLRGRLVLRSHAPRFLRRGIGVRRFLRNLPRWLRPSQRAVAEALVEESYSAADIHFPDAIRRARWRDLNSGGLALGLDIEYRAAARHGVEVRYPFLDQDLVEAMLSVPTEHWPRPTANARLHRRALSAILPPLVAERRTKAIFAEQVARRLKHNQALVSRLFDEGDWLSDAYVDRAEARALFRRTLEGKAVAGDRMTWRGVWNIVTVEAWLRRISGYTP